jgi:hypothetical protein
VDEDDVLMEELLDLKQILLQILHHDYVKQEERQKVFNLLSMEVRHNIHGNVVDNHEQLVEQVILLGEEDELHHEVDDDEEVIVEMED